ncbi:MAG TPA: OmpA family protein [Alphaproteobacteria bacterium]|nr:OmpA family protein [Alphaproteobacteria bacterium]
MSSAPPTPAAPAEPPAQAAAALAPSPAPPPPAASAPAAPPAAAAPPQQQRVAALPPPSAPVQGRVGAIPFAAGAADLPADSKSVLDQAAAQLKRDEEARLQIVAYASGGDDAGSQARRLSLSRALAVRSYLIDQGVRSTRMDVRALGNKSPDGPADRVDILMVHR